MNPSVRVGSRTLENAGGRDAFGADAVAKVDVDGRVALGCGEVTHGFECSKGAVPVAVSCGVFASEPADEVAVVEVEGNEGLT
jgi:hypothetical protein